MSFFLNTIKFATSLVGLANPQDETSTPAASTSSKAFHSGESRSYSPLLIDYTAQDPPMILDVPAQAAPLENTTGVLTGILRPGIRPATIVDQLQVYGFSRTLANWKVYPSSPLSFRYVKVKAPKKVRFQEYGQYNMHKYRPFDPEDPADTWIPYDDAILHHPNLHAEKQVGRWTCRICQQPWLPNPSHEPMPGYPGWEFRWPPEPCPNHPAQLSFKKPEPFYGLALSAKESIHKAYAHPYVSHGGLVRPPCKPDGEDIEDFGVTLSDLKL